MFGVDTRGIALATAKKPVRTVRMLGEYFGFISSKRSVSSGRRVKSF